MPCYESRTTILSQAGWDKELLAKALMDLGITIHFNHGAGAMAPDQLKAMLEWIDRNELYDGQTLKLTPSTMRHYSLTPERIMKAYSRQVVARDAARMGWKLVRKNENQDVLVRLRT